MEHDSLLNVLVCVVCGCFVVDKLTVEVVEVEFDLSTAGEFSFSVIVLVLVLISLSVKLSSYGVLVNSDKISDHIPEKVHLLG